MRGLLCSFLVLGLSAGIASASVLQTEFTVGTGPGEFTAGEIAGQNGWSVETPYPVLLEVVDGDLDGESDYLLVRDQANRVNRAYTSISELPAMKVTARVRRFDMLAGDAVAISFASTYNGTNGPKVGFGGSGKFGAWTGSAYVDVADCAANKWYDIVMMIDTVNRSYDASIIDCATGATIGSQTGISYTASSLNNLTLIAYGTDPAGGSSPNLVAWDSISVDVPEPATLGLLATGGLAALLRKRR